MARRTQLRSRTPRILTPAIGRGAAALLLGLAGCGVPFGVVPGPGVSGTASLGSGFRADGYRTLVLRAAPDEALDPAAPRFPSSRGQAQSDAELPLRLGTVVALASGAMPYDYLLGGDYGTTAISRWRLFAWLSHSEGGEAPLSGEPYGTAPFELAPCRQATGFCQVQGGIDVVIDSRAP